MKKSAENFLAKIEKILPQKSNPFLINKILIELKLDALDTKDKDFAEFIVKARSQKIDLTKLIQYLKNALTTNEPLCQLLAFIEEKQLIADADLSAIADTLEMQLNLLFLFEGMLVTMANSKVFAKEVYDHLVTLSGNRFPGSPLADFIFGVPSNATLFERLKMVSIKPVMLTVLFHRSMGDKQETQEALDQFIRENGLSGTNAWIETAEPKALSEKTVPVMGLNILEAAWEDATGHAKENGGIDNAESGIGLIQIMEQQQYMNQCDYFSTLLPEGTHRKDDGSYELIPDLKIDDAKKLVSQFHVHPQWRDLYTSWNLFFVAANIDTVVMPLKLLLPTVMSAHPSNYKETRVLSLFLIGNLFLHASKNNPFFKNFTLANADIIFKEWGRINNEYANQQLHALCPEVPASTKPSLQEVLGYHTHLNFLKHLYNFVRDSSHYRFTPSSKGKQPGPQFFTPVKTLNTMESATEKKIEYTAALIRKA
ncbi:symporter [Legionella taurinensis]|uniref:Symporter n=1 Tax=Legionella taurinensis TaxID=70611 RepID=A0AB38N2L8_9GAMM|nr:symporter [Legionella taurinensis]MDX1838059.1 symporter [Legionella taurinensis]PUT39358.1 symporter [Legionella taurinensis]PUT41667.1 symporter [Legionella taurinensis]PUT44501.1 symporter [Legionella taurinensis]PUT46745.1 symporter [Legionella taurinensis]